MSAGASAASPTSQAQVVPLDLEMTQGLGQSQPPPAEGAPAPQRNGSSNGVDKDAKDAKEANGKVRVPYLSETQRSQIKNEVRDEILDTARRENWAQPETVPDWVRRVRIEGEMIVRAEFDALDPANGKFVNFQEINRSGPVNVTLPPTGQPVVIPTLNSTEDRSTPRLRARIGMAYALSDPLSFNLRLSTGNSVNPASNNQTLGTTFNKPGIVLDRAYLHYRPLPRMTLELGRGPNQFSTGTDLIWDRDLSFDGISFRYKYAFGLDRALRVASGFYSVENTDPNYPANSLIKNQGSNKWLWGTQVDYRTDLFKDQLFRGGAGVFKFIDVEGKTSSPCNALNGLVACDTDDSRPGFLQKGNTLFRIRDVQPLNPGDPEFQFYGLATGFTVLSLAASWEMPLADHYRLAVDVDAARNLELDKAKIRSRLPDNNLGACRVINNDEVCDWDGGGDAWQAQLRIGEPVVKILNDWQVILGYRYVESDAVLDAFTNSDFHLGGTNAEGYYAGGSWGFSRKAALSLRYFGATEISSQKFGIDVWQAEVSVRF